MDAATGESTSVLKFGIHLSIVTASLFNWAADSPNTRSDSAQQAVMTPVARMKSTNRSLV